MKALAAGGAPEGLWLRADRQIGGRGRSGRSWVSPPGNLYASTLVRLRDGDPPAPTLALAAGVALFEAVLPYFGYTGTSGNKGLMLKWPNDLLVGPRKLAGILLERIDAAVIVGIGVNLAHHPDDQPRPATSFVAEGCLHPAPDAFLADVAKSFAAALAAWRTGLSATCAAWLSAAHPVGTPLSTHEAGGDLITGIFEGLEPTGGLRLRLADGAIRLIHAGDVFLV